MIYKQNILKVSRLIHNKLSLKKLVILLIVIFFNSLIWASNAMIGIQIDETNNHELIISGILTDSPGDKSGLGIGDKILSIDHIKMTTQEDVSKFIEKKNGGDIITIKVQKPNGLIKDLNVALEDRNKMLHNHLNLKIINNYPTFSGVKSLDLSSQLLSYYSIENGILVSSVEMKSPGYKAGIKAGDIIISVNDKQVFSSANFKIILNSFKEKDVVNIKIKRKNRIFIKEMNIVKQDKNDESTIEFDVKNNVLLYEDSPSKINIIDLNEIPKLFKKLKSDSTKANLNSQLKKLQEELNKIKNQIEEYSK